MKKPDLGEVIRAAGSTRRVAAPSPEPVAILPDIAKPKSRSGTRQVAGHFPAEVAWQLRELAVARRTTVQCLLAEALNDLFAKHGRPEIAPPE
jgi:hypothetical protein